MPSLTELASYLESIAPAQIAESWDNVGVLVRCAQEVTGVLCALDITPATVREARAVGCNAIVSHHPVIFRPLKELRQDDVIIGGAFGKIVSSIVADLIMPAVGLLVGGVNFTDLKITLKHAVMEGDKVISPAVSINYGNFIQVTLDFIIIAFAVFLLVKGVNALSKKKEEAPKAPAAPPADIQLLTEIRDLLKNNK